MTKEEWRYEWIKELIRYGITPESANRAFRAEIRSLEDIDVVRCAKTEARRYLDNSPSYTVLLGH